MKAHVICMDDSIEFVVVDDQKKAEKKLEDLAYDHYDDNNWAGMSYKEYRKMIYWHLHTVKAG